MSLSAAVLEALLAEGLSGAALVRVAKAAEAEEAARIEERKASKRAGNAKRQREFKARRKVVEAVEGNAGNAGNGVTPSPNDIYSNPHPTVSSETVGRERGLAKPDGVEDQVWSDFKQLRAKLKAPITATAMTGIEREAGKAGITVNAALRESVERNWRSFKAEWLENSRGHAPPAPVSDFARIAEQARSRRAHQGQAA